MQRQVTGGFVGWAGAAAAGPRGDGTGAGEPPRVRINENRKLSMVVNPLWL